MGNRCGQRAGFHPYLPGHFDAKKKMIKEQGTNKAKRRFNDILRGPKPLYDGCFGDKKKPLKKTLFISEETFGT